MDPYINTVNEINTKRVINTYKCFGTMAQLLKPTKRAQLEHLFSITIGYLILTIDAERIQNIVENKYCPAYSNTTVKNCKVLNNNEQSTLLKLLTKLNIYSMEL